jgi:hypothetical protein
MGNPRGFLGTIVNGRIYRGIGRVLPYGRRGSMKPKRCLQSLLLVVQAKTPFRLDCALPELVVYMASLHQSRLQRNRPNATVYGGVSNGFAFILLTITHDGVLKQSRRFEVTEGDMLTVLGMPEVHAGDVGQYKSKCDTREGWGRVGGRP